MLPYIYEWELMIREIPDSQVVVRDRAHWTGGLLIRGMYDLADKQMRIRIAAIEGTVVGQTLQNIAGNLVVSCWFIP